MVHQVSVELTFTGLYFAFSVYKNCAELYKDGKRISGVYPIDPDNAGVFDVFCDQTTVGGGGLCFRRDWMARLIFTAVGMTTNENLEI